MRCRREKEDSVRGLVEEFGETGLEAAIDDGGCVEEAFGGDWCSGELVF